MDRPKLTRLNVNIPTSLLVKLDAYAEELNINRTSAVAIAISTFLRENEAMKTQVTNLNKDLAKARKDAKNSKFSDRFFQVDRIKDGLMKNIKPMTLLFRLNPENKLPKVQVLINRSRHKTFKDVTLDILDIKLSKSEKKNAQYEISFNVS